MFTLEEIEKGGGTVNRIALSALPMPDLSRLVADTLFSDTVRVKALTELVFQKTAGNPFFVIEFLKALYHAQLLTFDVSRGAWQWDVEHIHAMQMTDNVVDLMSSKIQKLAVDTQSVIKFAACIGNQVDLKTLAVVCERSPFETASILWEAIQEGLILPLDETYGFLQESKLDDNATPLGTFEDFTVVYAFVHDRVQQAAYSLIPEAEKKETHLKVGRLLLSHIEADALEDRLFEIVNHLNFSAELIGHQAERDELAQLNLRAGKKAKASTAYGPALRYCTVGTDLLNPDSWEAQYDLTFALYMERAECEYLTTHFSPAEALFDFILKHAKTTMDQVAVYSTRLTLLAHVGQFKEAVDAGLTGLRLLKLHLPAAPSKATLLQEFLKIKWYQGRRKVEDLEQLPNRMSPRERAAINILANLWGPSFWLNQNLNGVIVLYMLNLTLRYGNSDVSPIAYVCYGMLLSAVFGDAKTGYKFGTLALKLAKQFNNPYVTGKVLFVFATFLGTYRLHNTENLDFYKESLQYCLETGDLVYAGFCAESIECTMPLSGYTLDSLHLENQKYLDLTRRIGREGSFVVCQAMQRWLAKLQGSDDRCDFNHIFQQEDKYPMETGIYYLYELQLLYVFEHYHDAMQVITRLQANPIIKGHPVHVGFFYLYYALTLASLYPTAAMTDKRQYRKTLRANQRKLKKWADHCPENFLHMYMLASAEMARVFGHDRQAERLYEQAIEAARTYAYIQYEASANELAAKYYLAQGRPQIAKTYLMEARYGYLKWGAHAKRQALDTQYAHLLGHTAATREPAEGVTHTTTLSDASQLDLTTVTKALQAVSGEIVLEQLLKRLMSTAIENAGAQKAFLILEKAGQFVIEAATTGGPDEVTVLQATPVAACPDVSAAIVNYVLRTRDHVVLHDAANEGIFIGDPYIRHNQPKSIMCAPLINQGKLTGVLYLENNLTAGAFTPDRLEVLHLLSSQSAISIENASLYNNLQEANAQLEDYSRTLEHRVAERTQELHEKNLALEIANQHIIAATERKTQFFNNMSHELRTPLDAIIGFSEVLQEQTFGPLTPRQDEYVNYVLTSGTHLLSLINDLLDLAKLDARMMELQRDTFSLQPLLERSLVMVQERAAERSITLSLEVADDLDTVTADARRVQQIMLNLLSNAVKFTPDHGSVGITATQAGDRVRIAVWDTGVGIAPEDQQRIFEEFQQIGDTRATKTAGTGLGLALTRKFVELHGGTIEVESRPGQGSTFTVFLPITGDAPQA
jgi:predicted ATPase/signal transduction histidine kinase/glutathione S-transferase